MVLIKLELSPGAIPWLEHYCEIVLKHRTCVIGTYTTSCYGGSVKKVQIAINMDKDEFEMIDIQTKLRTGMTFADHAKYHYMHSSSLKENTD